MLTDGRPCLKLADGQMWEFLSTKDTDGLIERIASLMELKHCLPGDSKKIIYLLGDLTEKVSPGLDMGYCPELRHLPKDGWLVTPMKYANIWHHAKTPHILCEVDKKKGKILDIRRILQSLYPLYQNVISSGGMTSHSAMLEYGGMGVLISATSGTGKSTCCRHIAEPWRAVCDDETLIIPSEKGYRVHPFPTWNDYITRRSKKTWDVQRHLPLSAIFFLQQSPTDQVIPVGKGMAAYSLYRSSLQIFHRYKPYLSDDELNAANKTLFDNACAISNAVPSFVLHASLRGRFWDEMEKVIPVDN